MHALLRSILGPGAVMIIAAACSGTTPVEGTSRHSTPASAPVVDDTVHVALGGERRVDDGRLSIRFLQRLNDDRCPANAICVRAGDARVRLRALVGGTVSESTVMVGPDAAPLSAGEYRLTVTELNPYPGLEAGHPGVAPWVVVRIARQ